jgi:SAM-dependent methyltransferase
MSLPLAQHQREIQRNLKTWNRKPLLQEIYRGFYERILRLVDVSLPGRVVEIGSGIGNLKSHFPSALSTDLFPNPWLDVVCDGYELPFVSGSLSHLILFDVFHHLGAPDAFLKEARRVLVKRGRVILFEPYMSWVSAPVYELFHHEGAGLRKSINFADSLARPRDYYTAQGNATRLFFRHERPDWPQGWTVFHAEAFASFSYLLSGGFSRPALYPIRCLPLIQRCDDLWSRWPRLFGVRCLLGLKLD